MSGADVKPTESAGGDTGAQPPQDESVGRPAGAPGSARRLIIWGLALGIPAVSLALWVGLRSAVDPPPTVAILGGERQSLEGIRGKTTEGILSAQGQECLACAQRSGCLDPGQQGGRCEETVGTAAGCGPSVSEGDMCLKTLSDIFASRCAVVLQETPCLCGSTDTAACMAGTSAPAGPILPDYVCDFNTRDVAVIQANFKTQTYGAGQANALVQCIAQSDCKCFGKS